MKIAYIDIKNFRKLKECRIDLSGTKTLFVGANNSGKTSAMDALAKFLGNSRFKYNDLTLSNRGEIDSIGEKWLKDSEHLGNNPNELDLLMPSLDIWLSVKNNELHYVSHLIPTLDWKGGELGVRFLLRPKKIEDLCYEYIKEHTKARETEKSAFKLWPENLSDYIERHFSDLELTPFLLDPKKIDVITQDTNYSAPCLIKNPFRNIIRVDMINAQRGFSDPDTHESVLSQKASLSSQLRDYYDKHLDPEKIPEKEDMDTLQAMRDAGGKFNENLAKKFEASISELEGLGYPGVNNPKIHVETKIQAIDSLRHESAVQYSVENTTDLRLPEKYNGLGYQNLISMIFLLISFRDDWMRVGKAKNETTNSAPKAPLHLVLIEEPEAHLHIQVQQVFIKKAYDVLRKHKNLGGDEIFSTQLIISTHSSHIAKEEPFSNLRYFKRLEPTVDCYIPTSDVINLSEVFGKKNDTQRFITRYLQSTHCELFFADAAIFVEGSAENMLIPHFIKNKYPELDQRYITILNINGRHGHRLKPLIDKLCLTTLLISDIDSSSPEGRHPMKLPVRKQGLISTNPTITKWVLSEDGLDKLLDIDHSAKVLSKEDLHKFSVRIAYQVPIAVNYKNEQGVEALCTTFEDSIIYSNLRLFKEEVDSDKENKAEAEDTQLLLNDEKSKESEVKFEDNSFVKKVKDLYKESENFNDFHQDIYDLIKKSTFKAEFALDLIYYVDPENIVIPKYISEGLNWLKEELIIDGADKND